MVHLLNFVQRWECPNCDTQDEHNIKPGQSRMHSCPGLKGLTAPLVPFGTASKCKTEATEREDYVGKDTVTRDADGKPIMNVTVTRDDGSNDVVVFAPCINVRMEG